MDVANVRIIHGGCHRDARGAVLHVNGFGFERVDRFYSIIPAGTEVRGWVGHLKEWKYFSVVRGKFEFGYVRPDKWQEPVRGVRPTLLTLSADLPQVIEVPPGHYTACRALEPESILLVFSSGKIEDSRQDDFRLPADFWNLFEGDHVS
jgi:dTDP-4-dehydrorhamnose 3,5-epimerase